MMFEHTMKVIIMSHKITVYSKGYCPYCKRAKALLRSKGVSFHEIEITDNPRLTAEMVERAGRVTVPQIFIDETHVGGSDDLFKLDAAGGLDPLLKELEQA